MGELAYVVETSVPCLVSQVADDQPCDWTDTRTNRLLVLYDAPRAPGPVLISSTEELFSFSTEQAATLRSMNRLRAYKKWEANWDAEGAPPPDHAAIDAATKLLGLLATERVFPKVFLNSEGYPMLLINQWGLDGELTVEGPDEISYFFKADESLGDEVAFDGQTLPAPIVRIFEAVRA